MRLGPLDLVQWLQVAVAAGVLFLFVKFSPFGGQAAITIGMVVLTSCAGLLILGDGSGVSLAGKLKAAVRWRFECKYLAGGTNPADKRTGLVIQQTQTTRQVESTDLSELYES